MGTVNAKRAMEARTGRSPLLVLLIVVLVAILAGAGFLGWQYLGTNVLADRATAQAVAELRQRWVDSPTPAPAEGEPVVIDQPAAHEPAWLLRIPKLDLERPIIAGVEAQDLGRGVGWYPGTALPGQVGNFALAGYRVTNGEPFKRIFELAKGDEVIVETEHAVFTYTLTSAPGDLTVPEDASWVLDPVPGQSDVVATQAFLTLTTAEDVIDTPDRAVGFGTLTKTENR